MGYEELIIDLKNEKIVREDKKGLHFEQSYYDIYKTIISGFFKRTISDLSDPEKTHQLLYDKVSMKKANTVLRNGFPEEFKVFGLVNKFDSMEEVRFLTEFLIWICSKDGQAKLYIMSGLTASEQSKNILPDFHTVLIHWMDEEEEFQNILGTEVTVSDNLRLFLAYEALFIYVKALLDDQPEKNAEEFWEEYPNADDINYVSLIRGLKLHLQRSNRLNSSVHPEDILSDSAQFEDILSYTDYSYLHTLLSEINLQTLIKPKTELAVFSKCCHLLNNKPENVRTSKTEELNPFLEKLVSYSEELENEALTKKFQDTIDKFKCAAQDPLIVGKLGKSNRGRDSISTRFQSQSNMWGEEYFVAPLCKIIDDTFQQNHRRVDFLTAAIFTDPLVSPSTDISSTEKLYFDHIKDAYLRMTKSEFPIISVINNEVMKNLSPLNPIAEKIWAAIDQQVSSLDNSNYGGN